MCLRTSQCNLPIFKPGKPPRGVDPAADDNLSLWWACECNHTKVIALLLDQPASRGVRLRASGFAAFHVACQNGHTATVRLLLALPPSRGIVPETQAAHLSAAFREAGWRGHTEIQDLLAPLLP